MSFEAEVIADSINEQGNRLTTLQLRYPRFIHSEFMTHRVFSRNASSSRAIPVQKMIDMVRNDPAMPIHWGRNQRGMQAKEELPGLLRERVQQLWVEAADAAADLAQNMAELEAHKQVVNRILEPFQHISVIVTATEWDNFFELRDHPDAQPEIRELAIQMRGAMEASYPRELKHGEWHLPYVTDEDQLRIEDSLRDVALPEGCSFATAVNNRAASVSAARCCRVSYLKHDGKRPSVEEDLALCDRLAGARPIHASPFEHQATPDTFCITGHTASYERPELHGNFTGWIQHRKIIESQL